MRFITVDECNTWVGRLGVGRAQLGEMLEPNRLAPGEVKLFFDGSDQPKVNLAQTFAAWLGPCADCLLWITEYGIWPSFENKHLFRRVRLSYGEQREIQEAPGHLFSVKEYEDLISYLDLALQFGWGGYLISSPLDRLMFMSHDAWVKIRGDNIDDVIMQAQSREFPYDAG